MPKFSFKIADEDKKSNARTGVVKTEHGNFKTPVFVPVATAATVKALDSRDLKEIKAEVILANTYHLHLRPGEKLIKKIGGLHNFMKWDRPIITDSGGFQAFSLGYGMEHNINKLGGVFPKKTGSNNKTSKLATVDEEGVSFRSHITGDKLKLTPKSSMNIQSDLGADIIMAFDECTSPLSDYEYTKKAMERTHRWALDCISHHDDSQALFGIVQGGYYKSLRLKSASFMNSLPFKGIAIGGSLGKSKADMHNILDWVMPILDKKKPKHLLGIGGIDDLFNCVHRGIDMFDCVTPTRWARRGYLYKRSSKNKFMINIKRKKFREDKNPIDKKCDCYVCRNYSKAYLRHLCIANELLYFRLASYHNVNFILRLMEDMRGAIEDNKFIRLKKEWIG